MNVSSSKDEVLGLLSISPTEAKEITQGWTPSPLFETGAITWRDCIPGYYIGLWDKLPRDMKLAMFVLAETLARDGIVWDPRTSTYVNTEVRP